MFQQTNRTPICLILATTLMVAGFSAKTATASEEEISADHCPPEFPDSIHCVEDVDPEIAVSRAFLRNTQKDFRAKDKRLEDCQKEKKSNATKHAAFWLTGMAMVGVFGFLVGKITPDRN